ncbi:MAG: DMT family transporter [Eubacteriales bacterium]|nr:DMT family transporter [Eubacteriales bacterium]
MLMIFLAILVGANTVVSRYLNAQNAAHNGLSMSTLCNYVTGLAASLIVLLISRENAVLAPQNIGALRTVMMWLGGAVGVACVYICMYIVPRMPAFQSTLLLFVGQLGAALLLDYAFLGEFSVGRLLGVALVLAGLCHYQWVSRKTGKA